MILEETLFEAKVRTIDLDKTVAEAMKQVMMMMMMMINDCNDVADNADNIAAAPAADAY